MKNKTLTVILGSIVLGLIKGSKGSKASNASISPKSKINATPTYYPSVYLDSDGDKVVDVDDPDPFTYDPSRKSIEQVRLSEQMTQIIDYRNSMEDIRGALENNIPNKLGLKQEKVYGRTKTPYSIINKLRRTQLHKLRDLVGFTIVADSLKELNEIKEKIYPNNAQKDENGGKFGDLGYVKRFSDYYKTPLNGYRAYHFNMQYGNPNEGNLVSFIYEIQLKTRRQLIIGDYSHEVYKRGKKNREGANFLTGLAHVADLGDKKAIELFDLITEYPDVVNTVLTQGSEGLTDESSVYVRNLLRELK